jgi:hypothetical protein
MSRLVSGHFSEVESPAFLQRGIGIRDTFFNTFQEQFYFHFLCFAW